MGNEKSGRFKKGQGGRPVGAKNILNKTFKESLLEAFQELQNDPNHQLIAWAKREDTEFYRLMSKLLPMELNQHVEVTGGVQIYLPENNRDKEK